jgi:excisionase family DNA binding protein
MHIHWPSGNNRKRESYASALALLHNNGGNASAEQTTSRRMKNDGGTAPETRLAYSVREAAIVSGLSRAALYAMHKRGAIRFVKCGRRTLILHEDLVAFLQSLR